MPQISITRRDPSVSSALPAAAPAAEKSAVTQQASAGRAWLAGAIPTIAIVGLLAGLAYWGHSNDWTLPKFSALTGGNGQNAEPWCKDHNVPEAKCVECNASLKPKAQDYGWCQEHGVAQCPLHHPDVAQLKAVPEVAPEDLARANRALAMLPRAENSSQCKLHERLIQFASTQAVDKAGVDIALVERKPIVEGVAANGEIIYDDTHTAHLASRVPGNVWKVEKRVGDQVRKGDILALVESAEIGRAKSDLLQAIVQTRVKQANVDRLQPLARDSVVPNKQFQEAEAALQEAQIHLLSAQQVLVNLGLPVNAEEFVGMKSEQIAKQIQFLGLPATLTASFEPGSSTSNLFPLRTPLDGVVVDCNIVPGEVVDTSSMLYRVTDLSRMWLVLDVRQDDAKYLAQGQRVLFVPTDSKSEPEIKGTVAWISTAADDKTRTVKVRVDLPNTDRKLRANTFGTGRIVLRDEPAAIVVPTEAVHWDGCCNVVFVRDKDYFTESAPKLFHVRKVRLGAKQGDATEIIAGVLPGEVIASKNSVVLEAQLLKSNLGAGCACATGH